MPILIYELDDWSGVKLCALGCIARLRLQTHPCDYRQLRAAGSAREKRAYRHIIPDK